MKPLVSIVITSFNKAVYIDRAIRSALSQTVTDTEIVIVYDGSTDNTSWVLSDYYTTARIFYMPHTGMMRTFNTAFKLCRGEYIATLDADDHWPDKNKLARQLKLLNTPGIGLVASSLNGEIEVSFNSLLVCNPLFASSMIFRRAEFELICNFHLWLRIRFITQDYPILLTFAKHSRIIVDPEPYTGYTFLPESISQTHRRFKRLRIITGVLWIKLFFIIKYGCELRTFRRIAYRFMRDFYCTAFKRWTMYE